MLISEGFGKVNSVRQDVKYGSIGVKFFQGEGYVQRWDVTLEGRQQQHTCEIDLSRGCSHEVQW